MRRDAGDGDEPRPPGFWDDLREAALEPPRAESPFDFWGRAVFWFVLAVGLVGIVSILGAMTPVFGYDGIKMLYAIHRISGMGLIGVAGVHIVLLAMPRRRR